MGRSVEALCQPDSSAEDHVPSSLSYPVTSLGLSFLLKEQSVKRAVSNRLGLHGRWDQLSRRADKARGPVSMLMLLLILRLFICVNTAVINSQ